MVGLVLWRGHPFYIRRTHDCNTLVGCEMMVGRNLCDKCINNDDSNVHAFQPNFSSVPILLCLVLFPFIFPHFKLQVDQLEKGYQVPTEFSMHQVSLCQKPPLLHWRQHSTKSTFSPSNDWATPYVRFSPSSLLLDFGLIIFHLFLCLIPFFCIGSKLVFSFCCFFEILS
jgi:hypothetical protein